MIALGTAQLGMPYGIASAGPPDPHVVRQILAAAVDLGVRYFDTAAMYGTAEEAIGTFLRTARPDGLLVGTKIPPLPRGLDGPALAGMIDTAVEGSRRRLQVDVIDDLLVHSADNLREYGERLVQVLERLVARKVVTRLGVSVYEPDDALFAVAFPSIAIVQGPFNVFDTRFVAAGMTRRLRDAGRQMFARSLLLQGLLVMDPADAERVVPGAGAWTSGFRKVCDHWGVSPLHAAAGFAQARSQADHLVVGVESVAQLTALMSGLARALPDGIVDALATTFPDVPPSVRDPRAWPRAA